MPELVADLRALVGEQGIVVGEKLRERQYDPFAGIIRAQILVRPNSTAQVSEVMRLCHARNQVLVPHGGLTGLVYGTSAGESDIILSMEAMTRIEAVDAAGRTMRVQAGVTLQRAQEEAERAGLMCPLDLGGRATATIGGNISTNAGGMPHSQGTAFVACPDFQSLIRLPGIVDAGLGGQLSAFEAMFPEFYELTTLPPAANAALLPHGHGVYALIESLGADQESDDERLERALGRALEEGVIADAVIAKSDSERRAMWAPREDVFQTRRYGPTHNFDISVPIPEMPGYVRKIRAALEQIVPGVRIWVFGHIADGNLHVAVSAGDRHEETFDQIESCVYEPLRELAGAISAEHGIGLERKAHLDISRSAAEIAVMRTLKKALDPCGILNPGKVFDVR